MAVHKNSNGKWVVSYFDATGKRRREVVTWAKLALAKIMVSDNIKLNAPGAELAKKLYNARVNARNQGAKSAAIEAGRSVRITALLSRLRSDYEQRGLRSWGFVEMRWKAHLAPVFGQLEADSISTRDLDAYISWRLKKKASAGTINRELAIIRRMLQLAQDDGTIHRMPKFPHLKESAPRAGFVEDADFAKLKDAATETWLKALITTAYRFGFRKGELLSLRVAQVDLLSHTISLGAANTKNGHARVVVMTSDVEKLLTFCVHGKRPDQYVFTWANGDPVRDFRAAWGQLCKSTGVSILFHDLRRSAVRNMVRRGVSEAVAMRISGHRTRSVFDRYNVTSLGDLEQAAKKIEQGPPPITGGTDSGTREDSALTIVQ